LSAAHYAQLSIITNAMVNLIHRFIMLFMHRLSLGQ